MVIKIINNALIISLHFSSLNYVWFSTATDKRAAFLVSGELFILSVYDGVFVPQLSHASLKWQWAK